MTLNAVQQYVKGLLNGLALPMSELGPLTAYIAPPSPGDESEPICYIWGAHASEKRQTMPRAQPGNLGSGGFKVTTYELQVWIYHAEPNDDPSADSLFPVVIDAVRKVLRNAAIQVALTDSVTGEQSTLLEIGEDIEIGYEPARALSDQRYMQYEALLVVPVKEKVQA